MVNFTLPYSPTDPVSQVFLTMNWEGQSLTWPSGQTLPDQAFGVPKMLLDWTVDQFFGSFQWHGNALSGTALSPSLQLDSVAIEEPFTLSDLSGCF